MSAHTTTLEFFGSAPVEFGSFPAESFTDWLGAVCMNVADPLLTAQRNGITAEDLAAWPAADVLALAMDEGQPDRTRLAALGALRIAFDAYAEEAADEAMRQQIHHDERAAFMVACQDCSLKLPRSGDTVYDRVFEDLLYLDTAENWATRRALFDALLTSDKGRKWLAEMAQRHARDEADSADLSDE